MTQWLERQGLANAARLAEKIAVEDGWQRAVDSILRASRAEADQARAAGDSALSAERLAHYHGEYARILAAGEALNPANTPGP